jgi:hypothetical protein
MRLKYLHLPLLLIASLGGCAKGPGPDLLRIDAGSYPDASILEPWRDDNATLGQSLENTIAFQRRRARFEFAPAGAAPPTADPTADPTAEDDPQTGPDLLGIETRDLDLTAYDGDLELRVLVIVERAHTMGVRRSTWSRRSTTRAMIDAPASDGDIPAKFWTPVSRDEAFERRLLAAVDQALRSRAPE